MRSLAAWKPLQTAHSYPWLSSRAIAALWALSTLIFLLVILIVFAMNFNARQAQRKEAERA